MMKQGKSTKSLLALTMACVFCGVLSGPALAGAKEDYAEGMKYYANGDLIAAMGVLRKAADAGHAAAQAVIGDILDQSDEDEEAVKYFRKSAEQGHPEGQFGLGVMLSAGEGVPKDQVEARKWITKAAEQGLPSAINELAAAYLSGGLDIAEDARKGPEALKWIQLAANNNLRMAMEALVLAYRSGDYGLSADLKLAQQWEDKLRKLVGQRQQGRRNRSY